MAEIARARSSYAVLAGVAAIILMLGAVSVPAAAEDAKAASSPSVEEVRHMQDPVKVPMEVAYQPAWLTWVAATTGCLKALGVECDTVDVAGYSGYAFVMSVHEKLCPSGPTVFDWGLLSSGVARLGRSTVSFHGGKCGGSDQDFRAAHELVRREIEAGRPCVLWGAYVPEFAIAVGVEGNSYLVKSFKPFVGDPEPPIPLDQLQVPGGTYVLAFPASVEVARADADRQAVFHALEMLSYEVGNPHYANGLAAYDQWIAALAVGDLPAHGNSYNAQCWAEAKRCAHQFLARLAERNPAVSEQLGRAARAYGEAAEAMGVVAGIFPFPDADNKVSDPDVRAKAVPALRAAKAAEARAASALAEAAEAWPDSTG